MRDSQQRRRPRLSRTAVLAAALSLTAAQASVGREPAPLTIGQGQAPRPPVTGAGTSTSSTTAQPAPTTSTTTTTTIPAGSGVLDDTAFAYAPTSSTDATGWFQYGPGLDAADEDYGHGNHTTKAANASAARQADGSSITMCDG